MKKILLLTTLLLGAAGLHAQSKATAAVSLTTGMTAKIELNSATSIATLTFTGPSDRWFALQIGSFTNSGGMQDGADLVYWNGTTLVDANQNGVGITPSIDAVNDWTSSSTVSGTTRTIVATRAFNTGSNDDYTFVYSDINIDFAWAKASSATNGINAHGSNRGYQRWNGNRAIAQHGLRPCRGDRNIVALLLEHDISIGILLDVQVGRAIGQRVFEVPHVALDLPVLDLEVGDRALELGIPVDEPFAAEDQALLVERHEDLDHGLRQALIHGKALARPVAGSAQALQLVDDRAAGFGLPLPDLVDKFLARHVAAIDLALGQLALHDHLRGDACMIHARLPQARSCRACVRNAQGYPAACCSARGPCAASPSRSAAESRW